MAHLGGKSIYLDSLTTQLSRGESLSDTAKVISGYANYLVARLKKHSDIVELATNATIPVINALTDLEHPCQSLSDLYTVRDAKKALKGVIELFAGQGKGSQLASANGTAWGLVNAVTEYVDHHRRAKSQDTRLDSAWFGQGASIKSKAWTEALKLVA